jgi:hypothetical protein
MLSFSRRELCSLSHIVRKLNCTVADTDPNGTDHFRNPDLDPDLHQRKKPAPDPDPHLSQQPYLDLQ